MSILEQIIGGIFGQTDAAAAATTAASTDTAGTESAAPPASPVDSPAPVPSAGHGTANPVEVAPILDRAAAAKQGETLEWRTSIVDLLKALDIDSRLAARKELAKELGYSGDPNDSASMNVWLHKQVMAKLAANGGKLPPEIKH